MAHIERLQVEAEGFLANLDVTFQPGLNAIIGARGTGKTSIVELIRYALGAGSFSDEVLRRGTQQAVAILDGGAVTVTLVDGDERLAITRSASGQVTRSAPGDLTCTVLAQNQISPWVRRLPAGCASSTAFVPSEVQTSENSTPCGRFSRTSQRRCLA